MKLFPQFPMVARSLAAWPCLALASVALLAGTASAQNVSTNHANTATTTNAINKSKQLAEQRRAFIQSWRDSRSPYANLTNPPSFYTNKVKHDPTPLNPSQKVSIDQRRAKVQAQLDELRVRRLAAQTNFIRATNAAPAQP